MSRAPHYNALIRQGIDDRDLYRRALSQVREPGLQAQVHATGRTPARHGTLPGAVRSALADMVTGMASNRDSAWVHYLARNECALLNSFEQQMAHASDEGARVLRVQLSRLHGIHKDMHCLAGTTHG